MPKSWQNFQNLGLSNCFPLSDMITFEMPNLQTTFFRRKLVILVSMIVVVGSASTHFVKKSIATIRNLYYFFPIRSSPIMSIPHWVKGHRAFINIIGSLGLIWTFAKCWHWSYALTRSYASFHNVSH